MSEAAEVETYLRGVEYPCTPQHLIDLALGNRAPQDVMDQLRSLPQTEFATAEELEDAIAHSTPQP
jgi:hypothetical protein